MKQPINQYKVQWGNSADQRKNLWSIRITQQMLAMKAHRLGVRISSFVIAEQCGTWR